MKCPEQQKTQTHWDCQLGQKKAFIKQSGRCKTFSSTKNPHLTLEAHILAPTLQIFKCTDTHTSKTRVYEMQLEKLFKIDVKTIIH